MRIVTLARALTRRTEPGRHYGVLTVRIAERADCARSTVYEAIRALEAAGILTWVNRIARIGGQTCSAGRRTVGASSAPATPIRSMIRRRAILLSPTLRLKH